jgi:hypothetical protein
MFISDPKVLHPGSRVKKFPGSASASKNLCILTKKFVSKYDPDPYFDVLPIPDSFSVKL